MANKGNNNRQKRISYAGRIQLKRKEHVWTFNQLPGPHKKHLGATIGNLIRDVLHFADNVREIKYILNNKTILVNGKRVKNHRFPIGLFDIVEFKEIEKKYRIFLTHKNKFFIKELNSNDRLFRPCKVVLKKMVGKDKLQFGFDNGYTMIETLTKGKNINVGDSVEYDILKNKFDKVLKLVEGCKVYIGGGPHVSSFGVLKGIVKGDITKSNEVTFETNGKIVKTRRKYVFAIPEDLKL